ncbi:hypothetical protein STIAU_4110, partial [Stigmatella aurantiaca DW4/3-1]
PRSRPAGAPSTRTSPIRPGRRMAPGWRTCAPTSPTPRTPAPRPCAVPRAPRSARAGMRTSSS